MVIGSRFLRIDASGYRSSAAATARDPASSRACSRSWSGGQVTDPTSGFRMVGRRGIELFARDYPHDYPEVEAVLLLHFHRLNGTEIPVEMRARTTRHVVDQRPAVGLLHDQGAARDLRRPAARAAGRRSRRSRARHRGALDLMTTNVQVLAIIVTAGLFVLVFELVRRRRLMERYALLWLFASAVLLGLAVWRDLLEGIATAVGIYYAPSALFAIAFGFVLVLLLHFSLVISRLADQTKVLAQRLGLLQQRVDALTAELAARDAEHDGAEERRADAHALTWRPTRWPSSSSPTTAPPSCRATLALAREQLRAGDELVVVDNASPRRQRRRAPRRARGARAASCRATRGSAPAATPAPPPRRRRCCCSSTRTRGSRPGRSTRCAPPRPSQPAWGAWQALVVLPGGAHVNSSGGVVALARARLGGPVRRAGRSGAGRAGRGAVRVGRRARGPPGGVGRRRRLRARVLHVRRGRRPVRPAAARRLGRRRRAGRARRALLRVREGRLQVVPPRAQPALDGARLPTRLRCWR